MFGWPKHVFRNSYTTLKKDDRGNFAILTALIIVPLLIGAGTVVDLGLAYDERERLQTATDAASLAGASYYTGQNVEQTREHVGRMLRGNVSAQSAKLIFDVAFDSDDVEVHAQIEVPTAFMAIVGKTSVPVSVVSRATAKRVISSIKLTPVDANGWWYKLVKIMVVREGSEVEELVGTVEYTPNRWTGDDRQGDMVVKPAGVINLGEYKKLVLEMSVKRDGCPLGTHFDHQEGSDVIDCPLSKVDYDNRYDAIMRTDESATMSYLFIDGVPWTQGQALPIESRLSCYKVQEHAWEDGGTVPPRYGLHDFTYGVDSTCDRRSSTRLVR